ncbi:5'-nucleotidase C-terminal domain-containing protein [Haladaptatus halobius]|uniref:5'-nucleotidase C-terminal domain-containing protein n=1 Tax=Haladaptatus halobius TaxID=2884875 RepID=UPI001D0B4637|nr:5'-nucleotidase [Haladaptatus halobius]
MELGEGRPTPTHHDTGDATPDTDVVAALRDLMDETGLTEVVGSLDEPILRHDRTRKAGESRLGNLVVDAHRWRADADVALSLGGIRPGDPLEGAVTAAHLVGVMPYGNDLLVVELPGERLAEAFRKLSLSYQFPDSPRYMFGHVSGATVTWDDRHDTLSEATVDDRPLDCERRYEVAVSEYFVEADNLFTAFDRDAAIRTCGTVPTRWSSTPASADSPRPSTAASDDRTLTRRRFADIDTRRRIRRRSGVPRSAHEDLTDSST